MAKPKRNAIIAGASVLVIGVIAILVFAMSGKSNAASNSCNGVKGIDHTVTITDSYASPQITQGKLCDKITFINEDHITREIAFGPHEHHVAYDGITEKYINYNQSFSITLVKTGTFDFHDHLHDTTIGNFIVTK